MMKKVTILLSCVVVLGAGGYFGWQDWQLNHRSAVSVGSVGNTTGLNDTNGTSSDNQPPSNNPTPTPTPASTQMHGVIEGFYGTPWSWSQRTDLVKFMAANHFNSYIYAPKDDPYQRVDWALPYPSSSLGQLRSFLNAAAANGVDVVYSISPGLPAPLSGEPTTAADIAKSITYTSQSDRDKLVAKIDQLRSLGVHTFMLSFDDIQTALKSQDKAVYGHDYARAHVDLANYLLQAEKAKDPSFKLWLAPTTYYGLRDNSYWTTIRQHLDAQIQVIWTGKWVLNSQITAGQAKQVAQLLGRKPILWDNYPVNDYTYVVNKAPALLMGPLQGRSPDLLTELAGYMTNPMIQPYASEIPLATIGSYLNNPNGYNPNAALTQAIATVTGESGADAPFAEFCAYSSQSKLNPAGNAEFAKLAQSYWNSQGSTHAGYAVQLKNEFKRLHELSTNLTQAGTSQQLMAEIQPWVDKLEQEADIASQAVDYVQMPASDPARSHTHALLVAEDAKLKANTLSVGADIEGFIQTAITH